MDRHTLTRLYDLHSWTGVLIGLFLYVLCFSGTVALFFHELESWERPAARGAMPDPRTPIDDIIRAQLPERPDSFHVPFFVNLPTPYRPTIVLSVHEHTDDGQHIDRVIELAPLTGAPLGEPHAGAGQFLRRLHTDLHLPSPYGRYLVGLGGIVLLVSIVTGVLTHRKLLQNLVVFRPGRSRRLACTDSHNVLGVWGLPFHAMIAFTGALLGLATLFLTVLALAAYGGDRDAALAAVVGEAPAPSGRSAEMVSLDAILSDARQRSPHGAATFLTVYHWGDGAAQAHVRMYGFTDLNWTWEHRYALATGALLESWSLGDHPGGRVYTTITPLHYGTYGGLALKALYVVLGFGASMLIATGMMIWLERRRARRRVVGHLRVSGLVVGTTAGMAVASAGALAVHHLIPADANRVFNVGIAYFALWLTAIAYALWRCDNYRSLRALVLVTATLLAAAPLMEGMSGWWRDGLLPPGPKSAAAAATNAVLMLTALAVLLLRGWLPQTRSSFGHATDTTTARARNDV